MFDKKTFIEELRKNKLFLTAMKMARSDAERARIKAVAELTMSEIVDALQPAASSIANASQLDVQECIRIVNERDGSIKSGSVG